MIAAILEEAGHTVALSSTIHFKIAGREQKNLYKMTMPGRFFMQSFLRRAVSAKCDYAVIEMTSEGARNFRHSFIALDALIFTNLSPEHIESHGSFENYLAAKLRLRDALARSRKPNKVAIANLESEYGAQFLAVPNATQIGFKLADAKPYTTTEQGVSFTFDGETIRLPLMGQFNIMNALAAALLAKHEGIATETIARALSQLSLIRGRVEHITAGQDFMAIVDYAHTAESLEALYRAFDGHRRICVLGNTGGGRDQWKRSLMGSVAEQYCDEIILTNEDPYDENPETIVAAMRQGIKTKIPRVVIDRRDAIRTALSLAKTNDAVLITGKGTDPYIMGPNGSKIPRDDAGVTREELHKLQAH